MARINRGILGGFKGKVANVVGSSWKGIETMRARPISVLNPRTTAQVNNRDRFSSVSLLAASMLSSIVKPLNDRFAQKQSGYNLFCSRNKDVFNSSGAFVGASLILSSGKLGDDSIASATKTGANQVTVAWNPDPVGSYQQASDLMYIAIIDKDGNLVGSSSGLQKREDIDIDIDCGDHIVVATDRAYLASLRADGTMCSNSATALVTV